MKRILRVGLMVLLTAVLGVGSAWGERKEWTDGKGMQWEYEEIEPGKTCRIWPKDRNSLSGGVDIPGAVVDGGISIKVVEIGWRAFQDCSGLTAVTIPGSVTGIGYQAFQDCSGLTAVTIPGSVTRIGDWSFSGCSGLTAVTIPGSVTEIGRYAFRDCSGLQAVTIPGSVTKIGDYAFYGCNGLTAVTIPDGVTEIEFGAFAGCSGLTAVTIPSSVTEIRGDAFSGCSGLTAVTIPGSVTGIGYEAFKDCIGLTAVTIPGSVTWISYQAFKDCIGLTAVTIPGSVTRIGASAFSGCSGLKEVTIPSSVAEIEFGAFSGCSGLKSIEVESGNKNYCAESGVLFTKDKATLVCYPGGKPEESYTIPSSVTKIEQEAFFGCSGLTAVTIPGSVTGMGSSAFSGCSGLKSIEVEGGNKNFCAAGGVLFTKDKAALICYPGGKTEESYTIPSSVTWIAWGAFSGCSGLQAVTIPEGVTTIEEYTFQTCVALKKVVIPSSVKTIEWCAFQDCSGLTTVTIPGSVTGIGASAFSGCSGLTEVYWLAGADCNVKDDAFNEIATPATLYVRKDGKAKIEGNGQTWWKKFDKIVEFCVVIFQDGEGNKLGEQRVVLPDGTATAPTAPTKEGYIVEWQLDGGKYDFSAKVTKDITLVAVWKKKDDSRTAVESVQLATARVVQNPVCEVLELEGMERAARVEVYSVAGARVHAEALRGEPRVVIDARGWAHGVYVVKVEASDGAKTLRVVK